MPEWLKGTDCKSVGARLRWFESNPLHHPPFQKFVAVPAVGVPSGSASDMLAFLAPCLVPGPVWPVALRRQCAQRMTPFAGDQFGWILVLSLPPPFRPTASPQLPGGRSLPSRCPGWRQ
ncbi:protein of unknown function [Rhodovastum atsumiense]|nr:protein of unknown function [Rhodovastum atsumiense]